MKKRLCHTQYSKTNCRFYVSHCILAINYPCVSESQNRKNLGWSAARAECTKNTSGGEKVSWATFEGNDINIKLTSATLTAMVTLMTIRIAMDKDWLTLLRYVFSSLGPWLSGVIFTSNSSVIAMKYTSWQQLKFSGYGQQRQHFEKIKAFTDI